jgi:hypothetical protein
MASVVLSTGRSSSTCINPVYEMKGFAFNLWQGVLLEDRGRRGTPQTVGMLVDGWPLVRNLQMQLRTRFECLNLAVLFKVALT